MFEKCRELFVKYQEVVSYLFFGVATTAVSWLSYAFLVKTVGMGVDPGNIMSWVIAVTFAFVTNKYFVFASKSWKFEVWSREARNFYGSRLFSGAVEIAGVHVLFACGLNQKLFGVDGFMAKVILSVVVVILNYVLSKLLVFTGKQR